MNLRVLVPALCLVFSGAALAQDAKLALVFATEQDTIGIDECTSRISESVRLTLTATNASTDPAAEARLYVSLSNGCTASDFEAETCVVDSTLACSCIKEFDTTNATTFSADVVLADVAGFNDSDPCVEGTSSTVTFRAVLYRPASADRAAEVEAESDSRGIAIDGVRPDRPESAPTVTASEGSLYVKGAAVTGEEIDHYEVCYRARITGGSGVTLETTLALTNTELQEGLTCTSADSDKLTGGTYKLTGLQNETPYEVVYAAVDAAGNRGPNSDSAEGTPVSLNDFAELYAGTPTDPNAQIEEGGCATTPARPNGGMLAFAALGLLLALRRRNR